MRQKPKILFARVLLGIAEIQQMQSRVEKGRPFLLSAGIELGLSDLRQEFQATAIALLPLLRPFRTTSVRL